RAPLEQEQLHAHGLELRDPLGNPRRRADEAAPEPAVRDRVVLEPEPVLELGAVHPLAEVLEPGRAGAQRGDALDLALDLGLRVPAHRVAGDAEAQRRPAPALAPLAEVGDLGRHASGW